MVKDKCDNLLGCLIKDASSREDVTRNADERDLDNGLRRTNTVRNKKCNGERGGCLRRGRFGRGAILANPLEVTWGVGKCE